MNIEERVEWLEKRNERMERQVRRLRKVMAGVGVLALAAFVCGAPEWTRAAMQAQKAVTPVSKAVQGETIEAKTIVTENLIVKDAMGNTRVTINSAGEIHVIGAAFNNIIPSTHIKGGLIDVMYGSKPSVNLSFYTGVGLNNAELRIVTASGQPALYATSNGIQMYLNNSQIHAVSQGRTVTWP